MSGQGDISTKSLLEKIDKCEYNLNEVLKNFENFINASVEMYDNPKDKTKLTEATKKLGEEMRVFRNLVNETARELPNDEPLRSHESEFDDYLITNSRLFIMDKIRKIKTIAERKQ